MKKITTVILMLSLVLGGVALAAAADLPQASKNIDLSKLQKITDQEAKQIRGTGLGAMNAGALGICTNVCVPQLNCVPKDISNQYLTPGPHKK